MPSRTEKAAQTKLENRIARLYGKRCSGIQINIMDTPKVMNVGKVAALAGDDDKTIGDKIAAYVETIRMN